MYSSKNKIYFYYYSPSNKALCSKLGISYKLLPNRIDLCFLIRNIISKNSLKILFDKGYAFFINYLVIKKNKPKYIITFIDNDLRFYLLKNYFNNIIFIAIQNGAREKFNDIFGHPRIKEYSKKKELKSDYIFLFGKSYEKKYSSYIISKYYISGSFLNNNHKITKKSNILNLTLISDYRDEKLLKKNKILKNDFYYHFKKKTEILKSDFDNCLLILPNIINFLKKYKNFDLLILGSSSYYFENEKFFYQKIFKNIKFKFIKRSKYRNTYEIIDKSFCVFFCRSTLGFEALARGKASFVLDKKYIYAKEKRLYIDNFWPSKENFNYFVLPSQDKLIDYNLLSKKILKNEKKKINFENLIKYDYKNQFLVKKLSFILNLKK